MLENQSPVVQALLGTLFTWGLTFLGAATAIFIEVRHWTVQYQLSVNSFTSQGHQRKLLDISLGFAAGVMLAASYWSLLEPALEMAAGRKYPILNQKYSFAVIYRYGNLRGERRVGLHSCQYRSLPRCRLCLLCGSLDLQPRDLQPAGPGRHQETRLGVGLSASSGPGISQPRPWSPH